MTLYSSSICPRCDVLKIKLNQAGFSYDINENEEEMEALGIEMLPVLQLSDGKLLNFTAALAFIKDMEASKDEN
jgi:hypothetical protein